METKAKGFIVRAIGPFSFFFFTKSIVFFCKLHIIEYIGFCIYKDIGFIENGGIMFSSNVFDYISVLDKAADASWMRHVALSNNVSNATTPGYKRQDVAFESELRKALGSCKHESMDAKVARVKNVSVRPVAYTDYSTLSYRLDGNNVDPDSEPVMLSENYLKYQGLMAAINNEFQNLQVVLK